MCLSAIHCKGFAVLVRYSGAALETEYCSTFAQERHNWAWMERILWKREWKRGDWSPVGSYPIQYLIWVQWTVGGDWTSQYRKLIPKVYCNITRNVVECGNTGGVWDPVSEFLFCSCVTLSNLLYSTVDIEGNVVVVPFHDTYRAFVSHWWHDMLRGSRTLFLCCIFVQQSSLFPRRRVDRIWWNG